LKRARCKQSSGKKAQTQGDEREPEAAIPARKDDDDDDAARSQHIKDLIAYILDENRHPDRVPPYPGKHA
jgi:hypothetical protein